MLVLPLALLGLVAPGTVQSTHAKVPCVAMTMAINEEAPGGGAGAAAPEDATDHARHQNNNNKRPLSEVVAEAVAGGHPPPVVVPTLPPPPPPPPGAALTATPLTSLAPPPSGLPLPPPPPPTAATLSTEVTDQPWQWEQHNRHATCAADMATAAIKVGNSRLVINLWFFGCRRIHKYNPWFRESVPFAVQDHIAVQIRFLAHADTSLKSIYLWTFSRVHVL